MRLLCVSGLVTSVGLAQDPTFSLEVIEVNSIPLERPVSHIQVSPGDVMMVKIFARDWSPNDERMRAYQAQIDYESYTSGSQGSIRPKDYAITSEVGAENQENGFIDIANPMYAHFGAATVAIVDTVTWGYRWLSVVIDPNEAVTCPKQGTKYYCGTLNLEVSDDAQGSFTMRLDEDPGASVMHDVNTMAIAPLNFEPLIIDVVGDVVTLRVISSDPPSGAIDARQPSRHGGPAGGWNTVELTFNTDGAKPAVADFAIDDGSASPPGIRGLESKGAVVTMVLDRGIRAGRWTTISYKASGTGTRIGYLPGDVDNDGNISVHDMLALVDRSEGAAARALYRFDIDRNGESGVPDALRLIDLFAAPAAFRAALPTRETPQTGSSQP
ncbi:MAG: hypothetical protein JSU86_00410 [Phycisphaerales bacterium]|nr:MAG: hypothetical protein JSU86_00410 [Phycisphaerales bacterium]